jgi:hypothetical protein
MPKPNPALKKSGLNLDITGVIINNNAFEKGDLNRGLPGKIQKRDIPGNSDTVCDHPGDRRDRRTL